MRIVAIPEFDFGPEQSFKFDFTLNTKRIVNVEIFNRNATFEDGETIEEAPLKQMQQGEPFEELEGV